MAIINEARQLLESFIGDPLKHRSYIFAPYTHKNIGRSYGLDWQITNREVIPGSKAAHRRPRKQLLLEALPRPGKYVPHCGAKERARHARSVAV